MAILVVAVLLRIPLAITNRAANDDHIAVVTLLEEFFAGSRSSADVLCRACFHPKLFHLTVLGLSRLLGISSLDGRIVVAQLLNVAAGIMTLVALKWFIEKSSTGSPWGTLCFALVALNPSLILINVQATDDTFVITFCVIATYCLYRHLEGGEWRFLIFGGVMISAGALTKGTSFPLLAWALGVSVARSLVSRGQPRRRALLAMGLILLSLLSPLLVPEPVGTYRRDVSAWLGMGPPNRLHFDPPPRPHLVERTYVGRPGVISVVDSYLTFRLWDLVLHPYITNGEAPIPWHRTSLWSQLYGRYHFAYFPNWVWRRSDPFTLGLGSVLMVVGFIPTLVWVGGLLVSAAESIQRPTGSTAWLFPFQCFLYLAMIIEFTYVYRSFDAMKDIYLFPGLLAYVAAFLAGLRVIEQSRHAWLRSVVLGSCGCLVVLYGIHMLLVLQQFLAPDVLPLK